MIPKKVWCYWEGSKPSYIEHCLYTIQKRAGVEVIIMNEETAPSYVGDLLHPNWRLLQNISQKVDCIRLAVLYKYGGMWCDADTIIIKTLTHLFDKYDADMIGFKWRNGILLNGYYFCQEGSQFMCKCLEVANYDLMMNFKPIYYDHGGVHFGEHIFGMTEHNNPQLIRIIPLRIMIPVEFPHQPKVWYQDKLIKQYLMPDTVAIALNHSQYKDDVKGTDFKEYSQRKNLLADIYRYSLSLG